MASFPISKSFLATEALAAHLAAAYGLTNVRCQLLSATLRDVYLVRTTQQRLVCYVYRAGLRSPAQITAEWQVVADLARCGVRVAPAILTQQGDLSLWLAAPEGPRAVVVTPFVAGRQLRQAPTVAAVRAFGDQLARLHMAADGLRAPIARPANDAATILAQAVGAAARALWDRPEAVHYLEHCARQLQPLLTALPTAPPAYGLIHGDAIRANVLVDAQEQVTLIDFDLCGPGLRAYDLASYLLTIRGTAQEAVFIEAFLAGYTAWRSLSQAEYGLLPVFEAVRAIFDIGVPATYVDQWSSGYLYAVLEPALAQVRWCMAQLG